MDKTDTLAQDPHEQFRRRMRPHALRLYRRWWSDCDIVDLRANPETHVLDEQYGIDTVIKTANGTPYSLQEKYRQHDALSEPYLRVHPYCPDFTQEYMNAAGTTFEEPGEWFHLQADLYFYGWAGVSESQFAAWVLLNVPTYKRVVIDAGGLGALGELRQNGKDGNAASFYCIPVAHLRPAVINAKMPDRFLNKR